MKLFSGYTLIKDEQEEPAKVIPESLKKLRLAIALNNDSIPYEDPDHPCNKDYVPWTNN